MRMHFCNRHVRDVVIIFEGGNILHPRCSQCDMVVPWRAINVRHHATAMCKNGAEKKRRKRTETELRDRTERDFEAYGKPLERVSTFKYLGRAMTAGDDYCPAVLGNLVKSRKSWGRLARVLTWEGADKRVSGKFFKAVVQSVLLFGAETWLLTPRIERALESFLRGAARRITGKQPRRGGTGNGRTLL